MKALEVFTYSIHYLHTRALEVIREKTGDENFSCSDIQWVLTVPAIWKAEAKQFMREAAYQVPRKSQFLNFSKFLFFCVGWVSQSVLVYLAGYQRPVA